jgi:hypothetical protein
MPEHSCQRLGHLDHGTEFLGLGPTARVKVDQPVLEIELHAGQLQRRLGATGGADQDHQHQSQVVGRRCQQRRQLQHFERPAERLAVLHLHARDIRRARDFAALPGAAERGLADAENALDVGRGAPLHSQMGDEGVQPGWLRRLGDAGVSEELDPVGAGFADADGAARLAAVLLVVVEHDVSERDRLGGRLLRPVLVEIAF